MKDDSRLIKRSRFIFAGSAFGMAACSGKTFSALPSLGSSSADGRTKQPVAADVGEVPPTALFQGYNSIAGNALRSAVEGRFRTTGGTTQVYYSICTSATEVAKALKIDQSLSVASLFGSQVDQKLDFFNSLNVSTYSITIVVYARHELGTDVFDADTLKLKPSIAPPATDAETDEFVRLYGDSWISAITTGGEYYAAYNFFSESVEEQTNLKAEMKAAGIIGGGVNVSLGLTIDKFATTVNTSSKFDQRVTGLMYPTLPDKDHIGEYALAFGTQKLDAPRIIAFNSDSYERYLPAQSAKPFEKVVANVEYFIGSSTQPGLTSKLVTIEGIVNQMRSLERVYSFYEYTGDSRLAEYKGIAESDIAAIVKQMKGFASNATGTFASPPLPSIANGTPSLRFKHGFRDAGTNLNTPFDDVGDIAAYLRTRTSLKTVQLSANKQTVQSITTVYEDANGKKTQIAHGKPNTDRLSHVLMVYHGDYVTSVSGRWGYATDYVDTGVLQLAIGVATKESIESKSDNPNGKDFMLAPEPGSVILGFRGSSASDRFLTNIGIVYATILPAKWNRE